MSLDEEKVYASGFAWKHNKKKFPYSMYREVNLKQSIKELKEALRCNNKDCFSAREKIFNEIFGEGLI